MPFCFCCRCSVVLLRPRSVTARHLHPPFSLLLSLLLSLFACAVAITSLALPAWQLLDLPELSAVHEHSILYDCIRSEVTPLDRLSARDATLRGPNRRCAFKSGQNLPIGVAHLLRVAVEDGDLGANELLTNHRFLPHHKAMLFFSAFTVLFALFSFAVGTLSNCFWPNVLFHFVSIGLASPFQTRNSCQICRPTASCSLLADVLFFIGANRDENRRVPEPMGVHQQLLSYAFFVHVLASSLFVFAFFCSAIACFVLLAKRRTKFGKNLGGNEKRKRTKRRQKENGGQMAEEKCHNNNCAAVLFGDGLLLSADALPFRSDSSHSSLSDRLPPPPPIPQLFQPNWLSQYFMERKGTVGTEDTVARRRDDGEWSAV